MRGKSAPIPSGAPALGDATPRDAVVNALAFFRERLLVPLYAAELSALEHRLLRIVAVEPQLVRLASFPQLSEFLRHLLGSGTHEGTEALVQEDSIRAVIASVADTPLDTVLNFLGLRFVLRLVYFLPEQLGRKLAVGDVHRARWRACLVQVELALPQLFQLASQAALGVPSHAVRFAEDVRRLLIRSMANLLWFQPDARRQAGTLLAQTRIRLFLPDELRNRTRAALLAHQLPRGQSSGLLFFCGLYARALERRFRSSEPWLGSALDSDCAFDVRANRVDVPLLLFNRTALALDDLQSSQLPRSGFRLARCLLQLLLRTPQLPEPWAEAQKARRCVTRQYALPAALAPIEDSLALAPILQLYRDNLRLRRRLRQDLRLRNAEDLSMDQLFFIYFTLGFCDRSLDAERRVNVPLWNTVDFQAVYDCRPGSLMHPDQACVLWGSG